MGLWSGWINLECLCFVGSVRFSDVVLPGLVILVKLLQFLLLYLYPERELEYYS
jgi:hypothetical protein